VANQFRPSQWHIPSRLISYIAGGLAALWLSKVVVITDFGLYATGYLVRFLLLLGVVLLPLYFRKLDFQLSKMLAGLLAAACVIAVVAYIGMPQLHLMLSYGRWWRFIAIGCAVLPLALADEIILRPIRPWWKAAGAAMLTRLVIAGFVITGVLTFNRSAAFLGLIIHFLVLLWMALWITGELMRRNVQNRFATALFVAVIQAWIYTAMFVMI
jgi:hypothetical protein